MKVTQDATKEVIVSSVLRLLILFSNKQLIQYVFTFVSKIHDSCFVECNPVLNAAVTSSWVPTDQHTMVKKGPPSMIAMNVARIGKRHLFHDAKF